MNTATHFTRDLAIELWVLYGFGLLFIGSRLAARRLHFGTFRKFQIDDYIMLFATITFTGVFLTIYQVAKNGSNYSHLGPGEARALSDQERDKTIWGSKMAFVLEEFLIITLWLIKACILLMYSRLTFGVWQYTAIKLLAWYCLLGFIVMEILLFAVWCRPFHQYWAVPPNNTQCATYYHHMIVATVFNISSDLCIFAIPLPLLIKSMMPMRRKLILCGVFSLGIFVILAAVLNRYYNFSQKYSLIYLNWYMGEVSTAVYVANIPLCWPLFRRIFTLDSWGSTGSSGRTTTDTSNPALQQANSKRPVLRTFGSTTLGSFGGRSRAAEGPSQVGSISRGATMEEIDEMEMLPLPAVAATRLRTRVRAEPDLEIGRPEEETRGQNTIKKTVDFSQVTS